MSLRVSVVVLAFGAEPMLERCVDSILSSTGCAPELVVVDNGCDRDVMARIAARPEVKVIGPPLNRGFAGGCNLGAAAGTAPIIALVNSDAFVEPDALARLTRTAEDPSIGIASGCIVLDDSPDRLNSCGNPVHFSGLTWSGGFGESVERHDVQMDVASASGAGLAMRRALWDSLGGFDPEYFAYLEDTELSLRCWRRGLRVVYVPDAVVRHHYEFSRNDLKFYLLERNRLLLLLTVYQVRTLLLLAPALALIELALIAQAAAGGWLRAKFSGYLWILRHVRHVHRRRSLLASERVLPDRDLRTLLSARIEPNNLATPPGMGLLNGVLAAYWALVNACSKTATVS